MAQDELMRSSQYYIQQGKTKRENEIKPFSKKRKMIEIRWFLQ